MKISLKPALLPWLTLALGCIGAGLRTWQLLTGIDSAGLLIVGHPALMWMLILTGLTLVILLLASGSLTGAPKHSFNFPESTPAAICTAIAGMGIGVTSIMELALTSDRYTILTCILGLLCAPAMLLLAECRRSGKRPHFLLHSLLSIYLMVRLICQYRLWSANPQLPDYIFHIFACVCLTLTAYNRAAFDVGMGKRTVFLFFSLMAVYLCFLSLVGAGDVRFYVAGGIWALGNLCPLDPPEKRKFQNTIRIPDLSERE